MCDKIVVKVRSSSWIDSLLNFGIFDKFFFVLLLC